MELPTTEKPNSVNRSITNPRKDGIGFLTRSQNASSKCKTTSLENDSPPGGRDKPCIFPFTTYLDEEKKIKKTFHGCTAENCGANGCIGYWCSIKVDDNGVHINGEGNWGYCNEYCKLILNGTDREDRKQQVDDGIVMNSVFQIWEDPLSNGFPSFSPYF